MPKKKVRIINGMYVLPTVAKKEMIPEPSIPPGFKNLSLMELGSQACRFPTGTNKVTFCGQPITQGPYCEFHAKVAFPVKKGPNTFVKPRKKGH